MQLLTDAGYPVSQAFTSEIIAWGAFWVFYGVERVEE